MPTRLAVIGAGPKAAALIARAAILRKKLGSERVPQLIVFDRVGVAAAWDGSGPYSSGFLTLCTPGEKDVGFPYDDVALDGATNSLASQLYGRFSWGAYLAATGRIADWVDRERDHPTHGRFADYLRWVLDEAEEKPVVAEVERILRAGEKWCVVHRPIDKKGVKGDIQHCVVDGVVLTGNGRVRQIDIGADVPPDRVFDAETFWSERHRFMNPPAPLQVAVAGDGGSAGTIVAWLAERFAEANSAIISISPMGTLFPRGDGHAERRWFTDPGDWKDLTVAHRRKLIERTEAGVISLRNKRMIDRSTRISYEVGHVVSVEADDDDDMLKLHRNYEGRKGTTFAHYLVNAIGFDPWSSLALIGLAEAQALAIPRTEANRKLLDAARATVELAIREDLSLPVEQGFPPGLHVPGLAALACGPGMSNLGCLGLVARKILQPYVS